MEIDGKADMRVVFRHAIVKVRSWQGVQAGSCSAHQQQQRLACDRKSSSVAVLPSCSSASWAGVQCSRVWKWVGRAWTQGYHSECKPSLAWYSSSAASCTSLHNACDQDCTH